MLDHPSNGSLRSPGLRSDLFEPISLQSQLDHFPLHRVEIPEGLLEFVGEGRGTWFQAVPQTEQNR